MKISTLFLLVVLGWVVWKIAQSLPHAQISALMERISQVGRPASASPSSTAAAPSKPKRTTWKEMETVVARGTVVSRLDYGLVVQCTDPAREEMSQDQLHNAGSRVAATLHKFALEDEEKTYGPVLTVNGGAVETMRGEPARFASGLVFIEGFPLSGVYEGKKVRILVAPLDELMIEGHMLPAFTAMFTIVEAPGDWMHRPTSLDRGGYNNSK